MRRKGFPICPYYTLWAHVCHTGDPTGGRCKDSLQHPGPLQRGLHTGRLHPRHRGDAERRGSEDGQLHRPTGVVKNPEKERGSTGSSTQYFLKIFLVWVLFGSKQKSAKFKQIKLSKKQDKSPDFTKNQEICVLSLRNHYFRKVLRGNAFTYKMDSSFGRKDFRYRHNGFFICVQIFILLIVSHNKMCSLTIRAISENSVDQSLSSKSKKIGGSWLSSDGIFTAIRVSW